MPRRRKGNPSFWRRTERLMLAASVNRTSERAISLTKSSMTVEPEFDETKYRRSRIRNLPQRIRLAA